MDLSGKTKIDDLLREYPFLIDFFINRSPKFKNLKSPIMRKTIGKVATLNLRMGPTKAIAALNLEG